MSTTPPRTDADQLAQRGGSAPQPIAGDPAADKDQRPVSTQTRESSKDRETLVTGEKPLGHKAPGTPFMLVGLGYMAVLVILALIIAAIYWNQ